MHHADYAVVLKAMSDETRLKIVEMLRGGEMCACHILDQVQISQPTLSYHMKYLCESGLVNSRRDGAWMRYTINAAVLEQMKAYFTFLSNQNQEVIV